PDGIRAIDPVGYPARAISLSPDFNPERTILPLQEKSSLHNNRQRRPVSLSPETSLHRARRSGSRREALLLLPLGQTAGRWRDAGLVQRLLQVLQIDLDQLPQPRQLLGEFFRGDAVRLALRLRRRR